MPGPASIRPQHTLPCGCGASITLDARAFGKPRACGACKGTVTVAWGRDAKTRRSVPVVATYVPPPGKMTIRKSERPKPTAPLIPLHLRPPLRVRIAPGAKFFECPCGERLLLRVGSGGRSLQCPACDRFHVVEEQAPPPPPPASTTSAASPPPLAAPPLRPLKLGEFVCKCREILPPRTSRTGKSFECPACGRKGRVEPSRDPETGQDVLKPVFTFEPASLPTSTSAAAAAPTGPSWTCVCGTAVEAHAAMSGALPACPGCGRKIRLEKARHPHSTMTLLRPVFEEPAAPPPRDRGTTVVFQELPSPPPPPEADVAVFETVADSQPPMAADASTAECACRAELWVSDADLGKSIQCPACGQVSTVERGRSGFVLRTMA